MTGMTAFKTITCNYRIATKANSQGAKGLSWPRSLSAPLAWLLRPSAPRSPLPVRATTPIHGRFLVLSAGECHNLRADEQGSQDNP